MMVRTNMLDIKFIRENKDLVAQGAKKKHIDFDVEQLLACDDKRRGLLIEVEAMRAKQNEVSDTVGRTQDASTREGLIAEMKTLKEDLQKKEEELKTVVAAWQELMVQVPNIPDMSVPEGASDKDNKELSKWGKIPNFPFPPRSHIELMQGLGMVDFERGVKIAGFRGYTLKGAGVMLHFAIWRFVLDRMMQRGFEPMMVPSLVNRSAFLGTGYLPQSEEDLYKTQDGQYLAGTAEVGVMGTFIDDTLNIEELPKKVIAFSPCFRREAGSHGKDTKGLMRVHEFYKLEQVVVCEASHETSVKLHEELRENAEMLMQDLEIPYHVVVNCGGDLGLGQVKKYDIEAWVPSEEAYRETHSASYFHDFQTRRLNTRYKDAEGKSRFAHSLNNTAIATPRILISLIENNQMEDGSIKIPDVLVPYFGSNIIKRN